MSNRVEGAAVIVTGAAKGIGFAIAKRYVEEGANVLLADINTEALKLAAGTLKQPWICTDVSRREQVQAMVDKAIKDFGKVDVLVNNAGIFRPYKLLQLSEQALDEMLAINLKSVLFGIQAVAPPMMARNSGAIVNIASLAAALGSPGGAAYCASKAGVVQLTNVAAIELASQGIRVNAIGPGTIETEMAASLYDTAEQQQRALSRIPMGRAGLPEEVAGVALFLGSDDSTYVTGKTIFVDGGRLGLNLTVPVNASARVPGNIPTGEDLTGQ